MGLFLMGSNFKSEESNKMLRDSIKDTRIFSPPWIRGRVEQHKHAIKLVSLACILLFFFVNQGLG